MAIAPGSLLSVNSFNVTSLAESANSGFRLRGNAQAIDIAVREAGQVQADRQRRAGDGPVKHPSLIAFDSQGRTVETLFNTGSVLDVFV